MTEMGLHANRAFTAERPRFIHQTRAAHLRALIDSGVHVVSGFHVVILDVHLSRGSRPRIDTLTSRECGREEPQIRSAGQALMTSVHATSTPTADFDPVSPGERLPNSSLVISGDSYLPLPLEGTDMQMSNRKPRQVKVKSAPGPHGRSFRNRDRAVYTRTSKFDIFGVS